jgi:hypothetical protein
MRSIRKVVYAAALGMSMFAVHPTLAAAEDAHGSFTLSHEVHWQKVVLRAGSYTFSVKSFGPSDFLTLRRSDGTGPESMFLAGNVESPKENEISRLVLVSRGGQSFVSALALPEHDMTLRFAVPANTHSK